MRRELEETAKEYGVDVDTILRSAVIAFNSIGMERLGIKPLDLDDEQMGEPMNRRFLHQKLNFTKTDILSQVLVGTYHPAGAEKQESPLEESLLDEPHEAEEEEMNVDPPAPFDPGEALSLFAEPDRSATA